MAVGVKNEKETSNTAVNSSSGNNNVSKVMLNNSPPATATTAEIHSQPSSIDGPISIQIVKNDEEQQQKKKEEKLPIVSKVHIKPDEEPTPSSEEDEMTVNIYNVTKSVVTLEKHAIGVETITEVTETFEQRVEETKVEVKPNKIVQVQQQQQEQRPASPLWTYTLPAPPVFADDSVVDKETPTDKKTNGFYSDFTSTVDNETVLSDSTTVVSAETQIQPIIRERKPLDESFIVRSAEFTKQIVVANAANAAVADNESEKSTEIITSDLEDGYLGNGKVNVETPPLTLKEAPPAIESNRMEKEVIIDDFKRNRLIITRSDSFHSIGQQQRKVDNTSGISINRNLNAMPQRSTSFLSLVHAQKAENLQSKQQNASYNRQRSTSELSISDVPSLQSLEVLKNILNSSRKNSLNDASSPPQTAAIQTQEPKFEAPKEVEKKVVTPPVTPPLAKVEVRKPELQQPQQWKYSGPPKINLSTWSERPKIEVSIKSDNDYKFGGLAATLPHEAKSREPFKRHTIHLSSTEPTLRKDQDEVDHHLPKVLGVEYKKDINHVKERSTVEERPTRTIISIKPRPVSVDFTTNNNNNNSNMKPTSPTTTNYQTSTAISFNRLGTNHNKFVPVVHGFKLDNIKENDGQLPVAKEVVLRKPEAPVVPAKPAFVRSTSAGDINRNLKFTIADSKPSQQESFSQTGLRKTGLKEKILSSDKETESIFGRVIDNKPAHYAQQHRHSFDPLKTEEKIEKSSINRQFSEPPRPPSLPPSSSLQKPVVQLDTRNQLMDAIKNFNVDSLRRK